MKNQRIFSKASLLLTAFSLYFAVNLSCYALEVKNLYQVQVAVEDQSSSSRWKATLSAFKQVLVRKSGSQQVLDSVDVQQAYSKVTAYIQRYEYVQTGLSNQPGKKQLELLLNFEPKLIDELILDAKMPIWGSNRPVTLMWLAIQEDFKRQIIVEETQAQASKQRTTTEQKGELTPVQLINQAAIRRGIPLILPIMDEQDNSKVSISDVWGMFSEAVISASERYHADALVSGRISRTGNSWQAKVFYYNSGYQQMIELEAADMQNLFDRLIDQLGETLCEKYCVFESGQSNQVIIQVSNIDSFASFESIRGLLQKLPSIRKVEVSKISAGYGRFNLSLLGDIAAVKQGIQLTNKLVEEIRPIDPFSSAQQTNQQLSNGDLTSADGENTNQSVDWFAEEPSPDNSERLTDAPTPPIETQQPLEATDEQTSLDNLLENLPAENSQAPTLVLYYRWVR